MPTQRYNNARVQAADITVEAQASYVDETFHVVVRGPFNSQRAEHVNAVAQILHGMLQQGWTLHSIEVQNPPYGTISFPRGDRTIEVGGHMFALPAYPLAVAEAPDVSSPRERWTYNPYFYADEALRTLYGRLGLAAHVAQSAPDADARVPLDALFGARVTRPDTAAVVTGLNAAPASPQNERLALGPEPRAPRISANSASEQGQTAQNQAVRALQYEAPAGVYGAPQDAIFIPRATLRRGPRNGERTMPRTTIASVIRQGLARGDSDATILSDVRRLFPAARTNENCVRWYRWQNNGGTTSAAPRARSSRVTVEELTADVIPANRYFGLEFEFLRSSRDGRVSDIHSWADIIRPALQGQPFRVRDGYVHSDGSAWELKVDGSCGYELVSPKLTRADWPVVERVLAALNAAGARVNRSCGLHVHVDVRDFVADDVTRLANAWGTFGRVISQLLPASRRNNHYALPVREAAAGWDYSRVQSEMSSRRYSALNLTNYWSGARVEFRQHNGTLNAQKTLAWLSFVMTTVEAAKKPATFSTAFARDVWSKTVDGQLTDLATWTGLAARVVSALRSRIPAAVLAQVA